MKLEKKAVSATIILGLLSTYLTLYTAEACIVAVRDIYEDPEGKTWWRTAPGGSLFPWPKRPGMLQALSGINEVDFFIYRYLIKPWILVGLSALLWVVTSLSVLGIGKKKMRN